tara:strand:- start:553 stop:942 length:390 start_codon:yes stop_codon:yes gene_type:complete
MKKHGFTDFDCIEELISDYNYSTDPHIYISSNKIGRAIIYENNIKNGKGGFLSHDVNCSRYGPNVKGATLILSNGEEYQNGIPHGYVKIGDGEYYLYFTIQDYNRKMGVNVVFDLSYDPNAEEKRKLRY